MKNYNIFDKAKATQAAIKDIKRLRLGLKHWAKVHGLSLQSGSDKKTLDEVLRNKEEFLEMYLNKLNDHIEKYYTEEE